MKVRSMISDSGRSVANQFILDGCNEEGQNICEFQSYDSIIVRVTRSSEGVSTELDETYWDYSRTTGKYRNKFLAEQMADTRKKIKSGEYKLADLN